ncbi:hypothetical protein ACHAWT_000563 [Skeletonema menzelii]
MLRSSKASPSASSSNTNINNDSTATMTPRQDHRNDNSSSSSKLVFPFRSSDSSFREQKEEISVSNLRKLYSSLLEELAPLHHELGTSSSSPAAVDAANNNNNNTTINSNKNANYRWKNNGTITVDGTDDTGYDYSYTPDDSLGSWRLGGLKSATSTMSAAGAAASGTIIGGVHSSRHHGNTTTPKLAKLSSKLTVVGLKKNKRIIEGGITGGDWSKDGVRRYHTGGVTTPTSSAVGGVGGGAGGLMRDAFQDIVVDNQVDDAAADGVEELDKKEEELISVADAAALDNLAPLDERFSIQDDDDDDDEEEEVEENDEEIMFDINILSPVPSVDVDVDTTNEGKANVVSQSDQFLVPTLESPPSMTSSCVTDNIPGRRNNNNIKFHKKKKTLQKKQTTAASIMKSSSSSTSNASMSNNSSPSSSSSPTPPPPPLSTFESLYNKNPTTTWRLRSAYMPTSPYEQQLLKSLGGGSSSGNTVDNTNNYSNKAKSIMSGINMAQNSEVRVCHSLKRIAEILCLSERRKGRKFIGLLDNNSALLRVDTKFRGTVTMMESSAEEENDEDDDDELEVSEAVFAYFCEKNVLPLLIDSFLSRPLSPLTLEDDNDDEEWWNKDKKNDSLLDSSSLFSGVSWAASVKSQILQTIAMLLLNTSSPLSLAYLLSNNYMNELIMGMLPLSQWREEALDEMLPPFVTLLRGLVMKLRGEEGRGLVPLLMCQRTKMGGNGEGGEEEEEEGTSETYLPLLYAAVQVFCYSPGSSLQDADGCMVRTTAMNAILNLCRITSTDVRAVFVGEGLTDESLPCTTKSAPPSNDLSSMLPSISQSTFSSVPNATIEQQILFPYICSNLKSCYHRSVRLMMTSINLDKSSKHNEEAKAEATQRNVDMASSQFSELQYWLGFLDDLLSCEIRVWNVRLVEWIMREFVVGTILLHWNRALRVVGTMTATATESSGTSEATKKDSLEHCKAKAEIRVSIVFLTQLFAMVSYRPLIRLAGAAVLHPKYPIAWCADDGNNLFGSSDRSSGRSKDFFHVTPIINAIVSNKERDLEGGDNAAATGGGEEADAGAGVKDDAFVPSRHRASLLEMLSGDETIIASMLLGVILENDALDDNALEKLGVLPSPADDVQVSPFEEALAKFLTMNTEENPDAEPRQLTTSPRNYKRSTSDFEAEGNRKTNETLSVAVEFVSSLGLMLMERIIFHTWTEGGECLDAVPFDHYYKSSKFVQALTSSLTYFASFAKRLSEDDSLEEYFQAEFNRRYVSTEANDDRIHSGGSRPHYENNIKMACCLQNYHPSNFIDDANVLLQSSGPPSIESAEEKATKCVVRLTLHLRSLVGCIEEFYSRFTTLTGHRPNSHKRWYGDAEVLSFCTIEEADELLLSIGGVQTTRVPDVGTDIDLRGRKSFPCSLQSSHKRRRADKGLILVVDPSEIYVARSKKGDFNRCTILAVVPLSTIIASASAGETLHVVCPMAEVPAAAGAEDGILKDGRLSLWFSSVTMSISVKELLDKYGAALENRAAMDIDELLDKCFEVGNKILGTKSQSSQRRRVRGEEAWADFQEA